MAYYHTCNDGEKGGPGGGGGGRPPPPNPPSYHVAQPPASSMSLRKFGVVISKLMIVNRAKVYFFKNLMYKEDFGLVVKWRPTRTNLLSLLYFNERLTFILFVYR
jgi:hypothetical protein